MITLRTCIIKIDFFFFNHYEITIICNTIMNLHLTLHIYVCYCFIIIIVLF